MAIRLFMMLIIIQLVYVCNTSPSAFKPFNCSTVCDCYYSGYNGMMDCSMTDLTSMPYEELDDNINILNMSHNLLQELKPFPPNTAVRQIALNENDLTKIQKTTFAELEYLKNLDLSSNCITHIDPEAFK